MLPFIETVRGQWGSLWIWGGHVPPVPSVICAPADMSNNQWLFWLFICLCVSNQIKSNQITFIVTSPQHKCLGEWNSCERAPDSAEKQQTIYLWTDSAKKKQTIYIWTDSAKKPTNNLHMDRQCKKNNKQFTYGQTVQKKQQTIYIWTDSAKKQQQFTYGQYIFTDCTEDNVQNTHTYTQYT